MTQNCKDNGGKRVAHLSNFLHLFSDKCKSIAKTVSQTHCHCRKSNLDRETDNRTLLVMDWPPHSLKLNIKVLWATHIQLDKAEQSP